MNEIEQLNELIQTSKGLLSLNFSRNLRNSLGDVKVSLPVEMILDLYKQIEESLSFASSEFENKFINNGIEYINSNIIANDMHNYFTTAHTCYVLRELLTKHELHIPEALPNAFKADGDESDCHRHVYFFDWSTVQAHTISNSVAKYISMRLSGEISPRPEPKVSSAAVGITSNTLTASARIDDNQKGTGKPLTLVANKTVNPKSETAEHGEFVAKKYLWMIKSASERGHEFDLPIEELSSILKGGTCHYTGVPLVHFEHDKRNMPANEMPDNYLTIDRKDNEKGYVSGNVVICSLSINKLKDQMSLTEFTQAVAFRRMADQAGLSEAQMQVMAKMMTGSY